MPNTTIDTILRAVRAARKLERMPEYYFDHVGDEGWMIRETGFSPDLQSVRESQFALGNGYMGARAALEEMPYGAHPGTYLAGVYDKMASQVDEMVNLPNPVNFEFAVGGQKLGMMSMDVMAHKRVLNMKKGVLVRCSVFRDMKKRRYYYQSLRFLSMKDKNIGVMQIVLTPIDEDCTVDVSSGIDTSVTNARILSEGNTRHFRLRELGQKNDAGHLVVETREKKHVIAYWAGFYYEVKGKKVFAKDNIFRVKLKKGQQVTFTRIFYIKHFPYRNRAANIKAQTYKVFEKAFRGSFDTLLNNHTRAMEKLWKQADVEVHGTANLQQNLRFNIYHMIICGHADNGFSSIGARTMSGEGYRGHIFWDAEIFLLPFYLYVFPEIARNMLVYRAQRLEKARELARKEGYEGAKFAWESAATGSEETPELAREIDGKVSKVHTHLFEHHITADIAFAAGWYYDVTGDDKFMDRYGYELLFETARFWATRAKFDTRRKRYVINGVIGPDEFHVDVNNNAYTNMMAAWNLAKAADLLGKLKNKAKLYSGLKTRLGLSERETGAWRRIAASLNRVNTNADGVIEQFDGYFKLKNMDCIKTDENGIPILPKGMGPKGVEGTQLLKQADVVMLMHLLAERFSEKAIKANYDYYIGRTMHKSSLSPSTNAIAACFAGDLQRAYSLFNVSLRADVSNLHGNTDEGIHAASLGGTWQAAVFGFGGLKTGVDGISIDPVLPRTWKKMVFILCWRKRKIKMEIGNEKVRVKITSADKTPVNLKVFGVGNKVSPGGWTSFSAGKKKETEGEYYV